MWFELVTPRTATVAPFYSELFDCAPSALGTRQAPYRVFAREATLLAGAVAADTSPYWRVYFGTTDVEAAITQAQSLGGQQVADIVDGPLGRMALIRDPLGALFGLLEPAGPGSAEPANRASSASEATDSDNAGYPTTLTL